MSHTPSPEMLAQVELENRRGEALMAVEAARRQGALDPDEARSASAELERADTLEQIDAVAPAVPEGRLPRPEYSSWHEEILELRRSHLEPGAGDWYAGMAQPEHLVLVWMCRDLTAHARELRRRLSQPYRLRCAAATVPLATLRAVEEATWEYDDDSVNSWGIDYERNAVVVTTDGDVAALAAELQTRFGDLVIVEFGHAAQI